MISEITKLDTLFKTQFNFTTDYCILPDDNLEEFLYKNLSDFKRGKAGTDRLLILYYAGHGGGDKSECIWAAHKRKEGSCPMLNFHIVKNTLLGHYIDVLFILDCCQSTLAVNSLGVCENWFLGASSKESCVKGVGSSSLTSTLIRVLERKAHHYWTHNEWFTVGAIRSDLVYREKELEFTPFLVSLNDGEASHTELTPLLPNSPRPRLTTSSTEPIHQAASEDIPYAKSNLQGLDCIYTSPPSHQSDSIIDVIFVHGYHGDAVESFSCLNGFPPKKVMACG